MNKLSLCGDCGIAARSVRPVAEGRGPGFTLYVSVRRFPARIGRDYALIRSKIGLGPELRLRPGGISRHGQRGGSTGQRWGTVWGKRRGAGGTPGILRVIASVLFPAWNSTAHRAGIERLRAPHVAEDAPGRGPIPARLGTRVLRLPSAGACPFYGAARSEASLPPPVSRRSLRMRR